MNVSKSGWLLILVCILTNAPPDCRAAATVRYKLGDLGLDGVLVFPRSYVENPSAAPYAYDYKGPQVDNTGAIHFDVGKSFHAGIYDLGIGTPDSGEIVTIRKSGSLLGLVSPSYVRATDIEIRPSGINASGTAVGYTSPNNNPVNHTAFVYTTGGGTDQDGKPTGLSAIPGAYPGTSAWYALGVNATGMIVGVTAPKDTSASIVNDFWDGRAMLSDGKTTVDLNTLIAPGSGLLLTSATSINDLGQIAGWAIDANDDHIHAYLLTPLPTPERGRG